MLERWCRRCEQKFEAPTNGDVYCATCKPIARQERQREHRGRKNIGTCRCGEPKSSSESYCPACKRERAQGKSPSRRPASRAHRFPSLLPAAPLFECVSRRVELYAEENEWGHVNAEPVLRKIGVDVKRYYEWGHGKAFSVSIGLADKVLTLAGWDWLDVWDRESCPELVDALEEIDRLGAMEPDGYCPVCEDYVASIRGHCPWHRKGEAVRVQREAVAA